MTRDLFITTKTSVKRYILGKNVKPLTIVRNRLYRTDENFMIASVSSDDQVVMYPIDGTQPFCVREFVDPDITMALIDVAKSNKKQTVSKLDMLNSVNSKVWMWLLIGGIVVFALLTGGI